MEATLYLKNKLYRHIDWNGQEFVFYRNAKNEYGELTEEIEKRFWFKGLFHDGGGYGGMLNFELYERDGGRTITKMKPMILCKYDDAKELMIDDVVYIGDDKYRMIEKNNVKNLGIAYELSLEKEDQNNGD